MSGGSSSVHIEKAGADFAQLSHDKPAAWGVQDIPVPIKHGILEEGHWSGRILLAWSARFVIGPSPAQQPSPRGKTGLEVEETGAL